LKLWFATGPCVAKEGDAAVARPDEQVGLAVAIPVCHERAGITLDFQRLATGLERAVLAEAIGLCGPLVRHKRHGATDLPDDQVQLPVTVPGGRMHGRGGARDPSLLTLGDLDLFVLVKDELLALLLLEGGIAGNQDHAVRPASSQSAADVDDV